MGQRGFSRVQAIVATTALLGGLTVAGSFGAVAHASSTATINGTVTGGGGSTPIEGVAVKLTGPTVVPDTDTDADGDYSFTSLAPGHYTVMFTKQTYVTTSRSWDLQDGDTHAVDAKLWLQSQTNHLSGTVTDSSSSDPISGASVQLSANGDYNVPLATTGVDGTYEVDGLAPDDYTVTVTAAGFAKNGKSGTVNPAGTPPTTVDVTMTADNVAPDTHIDAAPPAVTKDTVSLFYFTSPSDGDATFMCQVDSISPVSCTSPYATPQLSGGSHVFSVFAIDNAHNPDPTPAEWDFTVDLTPPTTSISGEPPLQSNSDTATFDFSSPSDGNGATFQCTLDGGLAVPCTSPHDTGSLLEGQHTFTVAAVDAAGNVDPDGAVRAWTIDLTPPDTMLDSSPPAQDRHAVATFTFHSSEGGSNLQCQLDDAAVTACNSPFVTAALADGVHHFSVFAIDDATNSDPSPASRTWTVDTTAPTVSITSGPPAFARPPKAIITWGKGLKGTTFECRLDGDAFRACSSPFHTPKLSNGRHTFQVRATDAAGNTGTAARWTWTVDREPPTTTIKSGPHGKYPHPVARFTFSASQKRSTFECQLDGGKYHACTSPFHTPKLSNGRHVLHVRATDPAGNTDPTPASRTWHVAVSLSNQRLRIP